MRLNRTAFGFGVTVAATVGIVLMLRTPTSRKPLDEMRAIASTHSQNGLPLPQPQTQDPCLNLNQVICAPTGDTKDSTGIVRPDIEGEQMAINLMSQISHEHPDYDLDELNEALAQAIYTPKNRARIESTFRWVRHTMILFIETRPDAVFTSWEKKQLKHRLMQIELQLPPPVYADEPDLITKTEAYYEHTPDGKMRLRIGGAYFFAAGSTFNMIFTLAHELAHGIDPCEMKGARLFFPAYDHLKACFQQQKLIAIRKNRWECAQHDQLSETFADWMAVHVTAQALQHYSTEFHGRMLVNAMINSVRDLCENEDLELDHEFHPPAAVRLDKIFGHNPEIREVLGCEPEQDPVAYCDFDFQIGAR